VDHLSVRNLVSLPRSEHDEHYLSAVSLAHLLAQAMPLPSGRHGQHLSIRQRYFDWLLRRILQPRFAAEPHLLGMVADVLKKSLPEVQDALSAMGPLPAALGVLRHFFDDLPAPVQVLQRSVSHGRWSARPSVVITTGYLAGTQCSGLFPRERAERNPHSLAGV
jgi:hypothetical protein